MLAVRLERVRIEERLAVERHAGEQAVEERALHHVDVLRIALEQEQAMVPEVHADRRAGFVVGGHVRQLVRLPERFAAARRADAAGEIELAGDEVIPDALAGGAHRLIAGDRGDVGHARVHVDGAHRVADRLALLDHLQLRLVVVEAARIGALALGIRTRDRARRAGTSRG